jgi:DNA adenine methylase
VTKRKPLTERIVNIASVPHRSPFRYPGGKTWLVPLVRRWLSSLAYKPTLFGEPFAGGGIVGLSVVFENLADTLTLVERDENISAAWQVILNGGAKRLVEHIASFEMKESTVRQILSSEPKTLFDRAFATILRNRVQRGGIMAPGASLMKQGENGRGLASRWYVQTLGKRILAIAERKNRITFIPGDGIQFLRDNAHRSDAAFFIDPPYTVAGRRLYLHSEIDHQELFRLMSDVKGDFLMTYDNAEPIRKLATIFHFDTQEVPMKNTHHAIMSELLIGRDLSWSRVHVPQPSDYPLFKDLSSDGLSGNQS